ncbi:DinB family protein [Neobacillus sp. LXY-4]|uniref:DinB family protein n=1 Tax=Neobacillus sp. LXY-4 TaxID=3379826 RepID=UPI003EE235AE
MKTIERMIDHLNWANKHILEAIQNVKGEDKEVRRLYSHILLAELVWYKRLKGKDSSNVPIWAVFSIEKCTELAEKNQKNYSGYINSLSDLDLDQVVSYKNSKGIEFENSVRDILTHVALHGQYHRGQINLKLRANGVEPAILDYIIFMR